MLMLWMQCMINIKLIFRCIEFSGSFKQMGKAYTKASKECEKVDGLMESAYGYAEFTWNNEDEVSTDELRWCAGYLVNDIHKYADQILNNTNFRIVHVQPSEAIRITHKVRFKPFSYMIGYYKAKRMIKQLKKDMPDLKGNHIHASFVKWPPKLMEIHMFQTNTGVFEIDQDIIDNKTQKKRKENR